MQVQLDHHLLKKKKRYFSPSTTLHTLSPSLLRMLRSCQIGLTGKKQLLQSWIHWTLTTSTLWLMPHRAGRLFLPNGFSRLSTSTTDPSTDTKDGQQRNRNSER